MFTQLLPSRVGVSAALADAAQQLLDGRHGGCVIVRGEAGVGKTFLLRQLAEHVQALGGDVAWVAGQNLTQDGWSEAVHAALARDISCSCWALRVSGPASGSGVDRLMSRLVRHLGHAPLLLVVDDLHCADDLAVVALAALRAHLAECPFLMVAAMRRIPTTPALLVGTQRMQRDGALALDILRLPEVEVASFVAASMGAQLTSTVLNDLKAAGGNPYLLNRMLDGLAASDAGDPVKDFALIHLSGLSASAQNVLTVAAVLGSSARISEVATMLGAPTGTLLGAFDELVAAGVLSMGEDTVAFCHETVREQLLRAVAAPVLSALRRDALDVRMSDEGGERWVPKHLRSHRPGLALNDTEALTETADGLSVPREVAKRMIQLVGRQGGDERFQRLALYIALLPYTGQFHEAQRMVADLSLDDSAQGDGLRTLQAQLASASPWFLGVHDALPLLEQMLAQADLPPDCRHLLLASRAGAAVAAMGAARAGPAITTALREVDGQAAHTAQAAMQVARAMRSYGLGDAHAALAHFSSAIHLSAHAPSTYGEAARLLRGWVQLSLGRFDVVRAELEAHDVAYTGCQDFLRWHYTELRAVLHLEAGDLDLATEEAEPAIAGVEGQFGSSALRLRTVLVETAVRRGQFDFAAELLEPWREFAGRRRALDFRWLNWAPVVLAAARPSPELTAAVRAAADSLKDGLDLIVRGPSRSPRLVRALLRLHDVPRAELVARQARAYAESTPVPGTLAAAAQSEALVAGDVPQLLAAVDLWRADSRPLALADALLDVGRATGVTQDTAVESLREAHALYSGRGATAGAHAAWHRAGVLGASVTAQPQPVPRTAMLTPAERRVAELVVLAMPNREIAKQLFLSPHTVDSHLRRIFAKLGIRSRVELVRLMAAKSEADATY